MAADGTIQIDINVNDNRAQNSINNLNNSANNAGKSFLSLGKIIAGVGAVVLSAKLVSSVKDFTVEAVKAAGAAQALNAQFSQVFGDLEGSATIALNKIADETSILPERLKGSFVQIAAFAKTAGFDNAAALDLSTRATIAAADSAAFYDKSITSVTESLQSYLKGNFENDAALGISSTETTRNAKANELYGKSFKDLSEAQKQLTLLAQVEDGNALAGALGQAAREGTGLENVTGNLTQAWENFKVAIGDNFLELAVQGIIAVTNAIRNIDVESISASIQNVVATLRNIATVVIPLLVAAFDYVKNAVSQAIDLVLPLIQSLEDKFQENSEGILNTVTTVFNNVRETISSVVQAIINFIRPQLDNLAKFWQDNGEQILTAVRNAFNGLKAVIDFVMPAIRLVIDIAWKAIQDIISGALNVIQGAVKIFSGIFTGDFSKLWEGIKQLFSGAIDFILGIMTLSFFGGIRAILVNLSKAAISIIRGLWDDALKLFTNFTNASLGTIRGWIDNVINFFRTLVMRVLQLILDLRRDAVKYFADLGKAIIDVFKNLPSQFLQIGKDIIQGLINGLNALNPIKAITAVGESVIEAAKNIFRTNSPSEEFTEIGESLPEGLIVGIGNGSRDVVKSINKLADETVKAAQDKIQREYRLEEEAIKSDASIKDKKKQQNLKELQDKRNSDADLLSQLGDTIKKRKDLGQISVVDEVAIWKNVLTAVNSGSDEYIDARVNYQSSLVRLFEQEKQLGNLSLADEAAFWNETLNTFQQGSDKYIEASNKYQEVLKRINDESVRINDDYQKRIKQVNDDLLKQEQDLTAAYEKAYDDRYKSLSNFSSLFDRFEISTEVTGRGLLDNLETQVSGFQDWQVNIDQLSRRAIDQGLLAELRKLGPSALAELKALNSLTDDELTRYGDLFYIKSHNARRQTENELYQLKVNTGTTIAELRSQALVQLDDLEKEWIKSIDGITTGTTKGLSNMKQIGVDAATNLYNGITSLENPLIQKAQSIAAAIQAAFSSALVLPNIPSVNFSGVTSPSSVQSTSNASNSPSGGGTKIQNNNITVETNNQRTEIERLMRQNAFSF